jgi:hypothetical protein
MPDSSALHTLFAAQRIASGSDRSTECVRDGTTRLAAAIESFNGKFRDECLNENWFLNLDDAKRKIEAYRVDYNEAQKVSAVALVAKLATGRGAPMHVEIHVGDMVAPAVEHSEAVAFSPRASVVLKALQGRHAPTGTSAAP